MLINSKLCSELSTQCTEVSDIRALEKDPLVSVAMITYNHEPYIAQAIEGVVTQETEYPFELIIGEDCSSDRTREIVLQYQRRFPSIIRVITGDSNVGIRKNGFRVKKACKGKYLATCEGDDFWHNPNKLQMQVAFLEEHPECGLVHTDIDWLLQKTGETISCWHKRYHNITQGHIYEDLLLRNQIANCTVCLRKECDIEYFQSDAVRQSFLMGDYPKWLFIAMNWEIGYLDVSTTTRRELENSASKSSRLDNQYLFFLGHHDVQEYFIRLHPPQSAVTENVRTRFHSKNLQYACAMRNHSIAAESYRYLANNRCLTASNRLHCFGSRSRFGSRITGLLLYFMNIYRRAANSLFPPPQQIEPEFPRKKNINNKT